MFPSIINPRSILTVSTFAIPRGADKGECGLVPARVRERVGRIGAAVLITELFRSPGGFGDKFVRQTPTRPASFRLDEARTLSHSYLGDARGRGAPGADPEEWVYLFQDQGRIFNAAVVLGPEASGHVRRDVVAVLDSLRFDAQPRGAAS
jgi:hypothetical protein